MIHKSYKDVMADMKTLLEKYGKDLEDERKQRFLMAFNKMLHWNLNYVRVVDICLEDWKLGQD